MTLVRLPTTPIPALATRRTALDGSLPELMGLLIVRDLEEAVAEQVAALLHRCDAVLVVDCGSTDGSRALARDAGARVLNLASPVGEGAALRAGMQLSRELGYIGVLLPGVMMPLATDLDRLVSAHSVAPEAIIMGVGPREAIAGTEWEEARALAEGVEAAPVPSYRPPKSHGIHGHVDLWFERLVQTRYSYAWGGPRILPLQSMLRRDLREPGDSVHMEILGLAAHAGVPTVEIEMSTPPPRFVPTCRRAAARLLARFMGLTIRAGAIERLGMGGGYAPPTNSPLALAFAASLAVALSLGLGGCMKGQPVATAPVDCEAEFPQETWPGAGDADRALHALKSQRRALPELWVEQGVVVSDPSFEGERRLRGVLARDQSGSLRIRFLGPMGRVVLDYVQSDGRWQLSVPPVGISEQGRIGSDSGLPRPLALPGVPPDRIARLFLVPDEGGEVRWQAGRCAVLETVGQDGEVGRRFSYRRTGGSWEVAREELLGKAGTELVARFDDYRSVGVSGTWAYHQELEEPNRGSRVTFDTRSLRTEGVVPSLFSFMDTEG